MFKAADIDLSKFKAVSADITGAQVIITDERIAHINQRHPGDLEHYGAFLAFSITDPDYILCDSHPNTAICIKEVEINGEVRHIRTTLRLHTSDDEENRENSILTFQRINKKEYGRLSRSEKVIYKRE